VRRPGVGGALFLLLVSGVELGVGPYVLTGFERQDGPAWLTAAGVLLLLAGLALVVACVAGLAREGRGTPAPAAPTSRLVVRGPYRLVRHPMYLGTTVALLGEALLLAQPVLAVAAAVYVAALGGQALLLEEPGLERRFGDEFREYRRRTPAFLPRPG
jgi:protein-S-isoprenylcysteine O-methyltransferase Ste14